MSARCITNCKPTLSGANTLAHHVSNGGVRRFPQSRRGLVSTSRSLDEGSTGTWRSNQSTINDKTQRTSHTSPNAALQVLLDSIVHIPKYGFSKQAYLASYNSTLSAAETAKRLQTLQTLFPGPDCLFSSQLFIAWNRLCDLSIIHELTHERVLHLIRNGHHFPAHPPPTISTQPPSESHLQDSLSKVTLLIEQRLYLSWAVRHHLIQAITSLSTFPATQTPLHFVPLGTCLSDLRLPNALPLLELSSNLVSMTLTHPAAQNKTHWIDPDGPQWYSIRARLTLAYTAATLHAASAHVHHWQESRAVLRKIISDREHGILATLSNRIDSGKQWAKWGGRGWLGVLRSLGW